jgi:hypothetical protein
MTKLETILEKRNMSQGDLMRLIKKNSGFKMGRDRISKICSGKMTNYMLETAVLIAEALKLKVDKIIELKEIKKSNAVIVKVRKPRKKNKPKEKKKK